MLPIKNILDSLQVDVLAGRLTLRLNDADRPAL